MKINPTYWFNSSMNHLSEKADESGEIIPRIKVFLKRGGKINQADQEGNTLLSRATSLKLFKVVNYLEERAKAKIIETTCTICLENIHPEPASEEDCETILKCNHVFHRACIEKWFIEKHNCPLCRDPVDIQEPEAQRPEMSVEEILAAPDHLPLQNRERLYLFPLPPAEPLLRRAIDTVDLHENTPIGRSANRLSPFMSRLFSSLGPF